MRSIKTRASISSSVKALSFARPPQGAPESLDPYFKGPNVLIDPGFENYVANSGGWYWPSRDIGVNDQVLPYLDVTSPSFLRYPNGYATKSLVSWCQTSGPYASSGLGDDQAWKISTVDPHSGDYHAAWWHTQNDSIPPGELCAISPWLASPFSARVESGDSVSWSAYLVQGRAYVAVSMTLRFYTATNSLILVSVPTPTVVSTSAYTQYSHSTSAPPGSKYLRCCMTFSLSAGSSTNWNSLYVDTCVLGIT